MLSMDINTTLFLDNANISLNSSYQRDAMFGDGFFTTAVIKNGGIINRGKHLYRLQESAQRLKFSGWNIEPLTASIDDIAEKYPNSVIRVSCSRWQKERGYAFSKNAQIKCDIAIQKAAQISYESCYLKLSTIPISVNSMFAGIKHLNRLDNVLAASECEKPDQEVLMCDGERVISGSRSNLFVKLDGQWITPIISNCGINGITQNVVMEAMAEVGIVCSYKNVFKNDLRNISASFVTNSLIGMMPVRSFANTELDLDCVIQLKEKLKI